MKMELYKTDCNSVCSATSSDNSYQWDEKTCEDINSINGFMCLVNEVKSPLQR
jgi:hypothetical protein